MTTARKTSLGRIDTAIYATGSFGTGVFSTVPSVLLLYFSTEVAMIPAAWAAFIVFAPKAWALFWDPFVGNWSDRSTTRFGRRRPFLVAGAFGVCAAFLCLFAPPPLQQPALTWWIGASYFLLVTLYALFAVPYVALPAEIGVAPEERSRLVSWRIAAAMVGTLAGAGLAPYLVEIGGSGRAGYGFMALWIAAGCLFFMLCPLIVLRHHDTAKAPKHATKSLWAQMRLAGGHVAFRSLVIAYVLQLTAAGVLSAATPYLVTRAFARGEGDIGLALGLMILVTIVTVPAWSWLARKLGEVSALSLAVIAFAIAIAGVGACAYGNAPWHWVLAAFALAGAPFAGVQVLPYTLVAHLIHREARDGAASEATLTGMWTAAEKLGLALGPALTGLALVIVRQDISQGLSLFAVCASTVLLLASLPLLQAVAAREARAPAEKFAS